MNTVCKLCDQKKSKQQDNICDECSTIQYNLIYRRSIDEKLIYPQYSLELTFVIEQPYHDGYCSDPCDKGYETVRETATFPLLRIFKDADMDHENDEIDSDHPKLTYYYHHTANCGLGSGYCYMDKTTSVVKAKVISDLATVVTLD